MSDYFDRVERQIAHRVQDGVPRTRRSRVTSGYLAVAAAILVVIVVAGVFLAVRGKVGAAPSSPSHSARTLVFTATPADPRAIDETVKLLKERLRTVVLGARVAATADGVTVTVPHATPGARNQILALAAPGRLAFYDWEVDVIAPDGKTVAGGLQAHDPTALEISQGNGGWQPGSAESGGISRQQAVALGRRAATHGSFALLQAMDDDPLHPTSRDAPGARFFVLRGAPALTNADVGNPQAITTNPGEPIVTFELTPGGRRAFRALTAAVARRGALISGPGETFDQHFAIAVDNKLTTVPFIDFKSYPGGIDGNYGADIAGDLSIQSAKDLAILLRYGPLPVNLTATG
jgi:hypothetical protein